MAHCNLQNEIKQNKMKIILFFVKSVFCENYENLYLQNENLYFMKWWRFSFHKI